MKQNDGKRVWGEIYSVVYFEVFIFLTVWVRRGKWLFCLFMTLATEEKPSHCESRVFRFFFSSSISKELIPNVYFISNQHPVYVRWGDKTCNYREAKLWLSSFPAQPCPQTRGFGKSSWQKSSREEQGHRKKGCVATHCTHSLLLYPQNMSFLWFSIKKVNQRNCNLKGKLSANPVVKNQLEPLRQAAGQALGFPHRVLSTQQPSVGWGASGPLVSQ